MNPVPMTNASAASFSFSRPPRYVTERAEPHVGALLGRVLENRYLTEELLDESPISTRYRAYDMATDEVVAVDVLPGRALRTWPKIRQAVTRLAAHGHPHVADLLGHGILAGAQPFLVFEMPSPQTLRQLQSAEAPFHLQRALRIGLECAEALAALHTAGVVHGRLSSEHVRVIAAGTERETIKVDGFGLAPLIDEPRRAALAFLPASDRATTRPHDVSTDIGQLGTILRELVSPAPAAETRLTARASDLGEYDLPRRIFDKIVARCFADRAQRPYPNAAPLCSDLRRLEAALAARGWKKTADTAGASHLKSMPGFGASPAGEGRVETGKMDVPALGTSSTFGETRRGLRVSPTSESAAAQSRVPATIHPLRARAQVSLEPALPKVIVSLGACEPTPPERPTRCSPAAKKRTFDGQSCSASSTTSSSS